MKLSHFSKRCSSVLFNLRVDKFIICESVSGFVICFCISIGLSTKNPVYFDLE